MAITRFPLREAAADRLAGFMVHLRLNGMALGVQDTGLALAALTQVKATDQSEVRSALKAICTSSADDFAHFDDLFAAYWTNVGRERAGKAGTASERQRSAQIAEQDGLAGAGQAERPDTDGAGAAEQDGQGRLVGSRIRNILHVDLRQVVDKTTCPRNPGSAITQTQGAPAGRTAGPAADHPRQSGHWRRSGPAVSPASSRTAHATCVPA
jgi:uncharacterized protein